ncbi:MAG TPA: PEP-CTERM sorting domain-containing protein [Steroidobacteraceae bacterium]
MTQDECLALPHHATHLGVCYPGTDFSLTLSDPNHPQPVNFKVSSVPEPSTLALFALALVLGVVSLRIRPRGGRREMEAGARFESYVGGATAA